MQRDLLQLQQHHDQDAIVPVTFTYYFAELGDIYPQPNFMISAPDAVTLSDGSILVAASDTPLSAASILNADGVETLPLSGLPFSRPAVTALAGGGFAMAGFNDGNLVISGFNSAGAGIFTATRDYSYVLNNADIVQLTGGNIVTVCQGDFDPDLKDFDIYMDIRSATGDGGTFAGLAMDTGSDTNPCAAALANGDVAVAWTHWNETTSSSEVIFGIYDSAGNVVKAPTVADAVGTVNNDVSIVATPDGFVLAYTDNEANGIYTDIGLTAFDMAGNFQGHTLIGSDGYDDSRAALSTVSGNLLALTRTVFNVDLDIHVSLIDATTLASLTSSNVTQLPFGTHQNYSTVTTAALGHVAVFWQEVPYFGNSEVSGILLQAVRQAEGTAVDDVITGDDMRDQFQGRDGDDVLVGRGNSDTLNGQGGDDTLVGGSESDTLWGSLGADMLNCGSGNDYANGGEGADVMSGGSGIDVLSYLGSAQGVTVNLKLGTAAGGDAEGDIFTGFETLEGSAHADVLTGSALANRIFGGLGKDVMAGGAGRDTFVFETVSTSPGGTADVITDFRLDAAAGTAFFDRIDVSLIDATASTGTNDPFTFVGTGRFTGEGQIRAVALGTDTLLRFNTLGATGAEMDILLKNVTAASLTDADFIL